MYENITVESIKATILANLAAAGWSTGEGSTAELLAGPMALVLWQRYQADRALVPMFYIDETSGPYIDRWAGLLGITRKAGSFAGADITLTGVGGTQVPAGTLFLTSDGLEFGLDTAVTLDGSGSGSGHVTAAGEGTVYNIDAGELTRMYVNLGGLTAYANGAASGGMDAESDAALCSRVLTRLSRPPTSGNVYHYEQMALEVSGVGTPKVFPLYDGPGTVKVILAGADALPVDASVVQAVETRIAGERIIGATVTVASAEGVTIDVEATVELDSTTTAAAVQAELEASLSAYLTGLTKNTWPDATGSYTVLYNRIAALLLSIDGVVDYSDLGVNGTQANVTLTPEQIPVLGTVTVHETD